MAEQEDLELTSCQRHPKITTIYRAIVCEDNLNTEKIFQSRRYKEGTTMGWVGEAETRRSQDPHPASRRLTSSRIITIAEVYPKEQGT